MTRLFMASLMAAALVMTAVAITSAAYMYTDDGGTAVIVDAIEKVPQKHRASAKQLQSDGKPDGFTPSLEQARKLENGEPGGQWYRYEQMKWHERVYLKARAGAFDMEGMLKSISHWIGLAALFLAASFMVTFRMVSSRIAQALICLCLIVAVSCGLFYEYMRGVENRKGVIVQKIEQKRAEKQSESLDRLLSALGE